MSSQVLVSDTFFLSGERLDRLRQALKVAEHQARVAQSSGYGRHVEDALTEIEEAIRDHLARIENALDDEKAEAAESGEAERGWRSWFPRYETV
jgi:RecB family exonuclease